MAILDCESLPFRSAIRQAAYGCVRTRFLALGMLRLLLLIRHCSMRYQGLHAASRSRAFHRTIGARRLVLTTDIVRKA